MNNKHLGLFTLIAGLQVFAAPAVDKAVLERIADDETAMSTVVVALKDPYDLSKLPNVADPKERTAALIKTLEEHTNQAITNTLPFLIVGADTGIQEVTPLWIAHAVRVTAKPEVLQRLTTWWGIDSIILEKRKEVSEMEDVALATLHPRLDASTIGWGVEKLGVPKLWTPENGKTPITGEGALVALIDSGVTIEHPDLKPNIYNNPGEVGTDAAGKDKATNGVDDDANGFVDDVNGWNFEDKNNKPVDKNGHGSQTAGIVVGMGTGGTQTGVAPGAKLVPIRACCDLGGKAGETAIIEGMQYAMKIGARVISMSLSIKPFSNPNYAMFRKASETLLAAGVIHVNSAGNLGSGNAPKNMGAPATNPPPWYHPLQTQGTALTSMITIGATDKDDKLRSYSSTGPVTWQEVSDYKDFPWEKNSKDKPGLIKPDVCGPSEVPSTSKDGKTYTKDFGGTSSATPHIAGVVALLVSVKADLTPAQAIEALQNTALQVEGQAFSNKCGAGRVDAVAAVEYVQKHFIKN